MDVPFTSSDVCLGQRRNVRCIEKDPESKGFCSSSCFDSWRPYLTYCLCPPHHYLPYLVGDGRITHGWETLLYTFTKPRKRLENKAYLLHTSAIRANGMVNSQAGRWETSPWRQRKYKWERHLPGHQDTTQATYLPIPPNAMLERKSWCPRRTSAWSSFP